MATELRSLNLVTYDRACLDLSWRWLNDPEIRDLTMTPIFSREQQEAFFRELPDRKDYMIWGVALGSGEIIGAAGLKNFRNDTAEYWGYIGEREYWGQGLGKLLLECVEAKATEHGFRRLDLRVSSTNVRAIRLYEGAGFVTAAQGANDLHMVKQVLHVR